MASAVLVGAAFAVLLGDAASCWRSGRIRGGSRAVVLGVPLHAGRAPVRFCWGTHAGRIVSSRCRAVGNGTANHASPRLQNPEAAAWCVRGAFVGHDGGWLRAPALGPRG
ncbi:hypothetical protein GCM10009735_18690 [Actinomadura chokoriensis]